ncbi:KAP family P-loop NTPase fold protein [Tenacibaculum piscium]|uniref:KAP family P-loop NTPase fold protein n=1 Tax=Tenacibaculum piscium TaxID=1458515 RepID=UPI001EFA7BF4|nr:P-loop NTPase fold protein [Tenacibaculum piscium]MCG8182802.1 hypothetical protein [Tenacibaculum piscium]MCG8204194.1 hypothetical protein [Tenacibaculum piscium]
MISNSPISKNNGIDLFNFKHYAKKVQKIIQNNSNNSEPLTIGIYGKWGEGKTSFLNLINDEIDIWKDKEKGQKGILKYHFNPWRYSTEEEMLFDFFDGLSKMMFVNKKNETLQKVGKQLLKYSRYTKAVKLSASVGFSSNKAGATFDVSEIMKALGEDFIGKEVTLESLIQNINDKLKASKYKIVVFIDDIDRLDKDEIYTILKLIKLNANFNNFVYIVALDENHVAKAIGQRYGVDTKDGELFLEKIINIPIHLPKIESADFKYFFEIKLEEVFNNLGFSNRKEEKNEIRNEFRVQYLKNGREIIRVLNSFFVGAFAIGEEVNLRDLFWIEYLKITDNESYSIIKNKSFEDVIFIKNYTIFNFFEDLSILSTNAELPKGNAYKIISMLFPDKDNNNKYLSEDEQYIIKINKNLRINSFYHFEKYFSYHMERKFSKVKDKEILQNIIDEKEEELKENLLTVRDNLEIHHFYSVIEDFINDENRNYLFFYNFLFSNLDIIPETEIDNFGLTYKRRVIELIASNLDKNNSSNDEIFQLAKKLTIHQLCYFTIIIDLKIATKKKLEVLIVDKAKEEYINKPTPFFNDLTKEHLHYKMIMSLWKENDENSFDKYIENQTNNFDNILKLIRNFPGFWNNKYFGDLDETNYNYMKKIINVDIVYQKIEGMKPELIKKIDIRDSMFFSVKNRPSELENVEQFIFFYKKDKNLIN